MHIWTDQLLAVQTLNWNSHHIDDYIMEVMALVRDVNETLATIKGNVKRTSEVLAGWVANPMFDRKEGKVSTAISSLYLHLHQEFLSSYASQMTRSCAKRSADCLVECCGESCAHEQHMRPAFC